MLTIILYIVSFLDIHVDPCNGWNRFDGYCYQFFPHKKTWEVSQLFCKQHQSNLVSVHSQLENNFLTELSSGQEAWIGLTDVSSEGMFDFVDGTALQYTNWDLILGEPNNLDDEDCVILSFIYDGKWTDIDCLSPVNFICKRNESSIVL